MLTLDKFIELSNEFVGVLYDVGPNGAGGNDVKVFEQLGLDPEIITMIGDSVPEYCIAPMLNGLILGWFMHEKMTNNANQQIGSKNE